MSCPRGAPDRSLSISVVIPTLRSYDTLGRVLDGFTSQSLCPDRFEVIVVSDAGEPHPTAVSRTIGTRPFSVRHLVGPRPGASANRNLGWRASRAPLVVFTDNDTIPQSQLLAEHLEWHERHPAFSDGVVGLVRWAPEIRVTTFMRWLDTGIQFDYANMQEGDVGWGRFCSANVSLKKELLERVGGFDQERFPYGYEDTEWAYRASKCGFRLFYNPRATVDHLREMSLEFWKKRARRIGASEREFCRLHPEADAWFHRLFSAAISRPAARGRGVVVAPFVPRGVPWLGPRVWNSVDVKFKQELGPHFFEGWSAAEGEATRVQPDLGEWA